MLGVSVREGPRGCSKTVEITGFVRVDRRTKNLIPRLKPGDMAVIAHRDLDSVAAEGLRDAQVSLVINSEPSFSGRYPTDGPRLLLDAGIPILDKVGPRAMALRDGDQVTIRGTAVYRGSEYVGSGTWLTLQEYQRIAAIAWDNLHHELQRFVDNTLDYAAREKSLFLGKLSLPALDIPLLGRHAVVTVRGRGYREDLQTILPYIREVRPVLVGVDGGADALWELGLVPDVIVGDMDSVSDEVLKCGAELVVHAYPNGEAPGLERLRGLGLKAKVAPLPGTSEDLALLLASEGGADLVVAVGTHTDAIDFFEKGRAGMASTFLTRMRVGNRLVDAKGVSQLYRVQHVAPHYAAVAPPASSP